VNAKLYGTSGELGPDDVHIWTFACAQDPGLQIVALSDEERRIADRFAAQVHRDAYIVQHVMLRCLLARYVDLDPHAIQFVRGARGKPRLAGASTNAGIEFSLAHADDVAVLAISRGPVGVDIERYDAAIDPQRLARIVLAPSEAQCIDRRAFMRVWCRKEACLKATGVGLLDDLTAVAVLDDTVVVEGTTLYVEDLALDEEHATALATSTRCSSNPTLHPQVMGSVDVPAYSDYFVKS
jgi:4'-phosphopantetheinyl transferase